VRLSVFSVVDAYPEHFDGGRDRYRELLELARAVDRSSLARIWIAEHHFLPSGVCPSPPVALAALGAVTRRCRLGAMVAVLPFHPALDLAEQYALVDRLVGGRLDLGIGSGYIPGEFEGFGVDPAEKHARFDAALALLEAAWAGEEVVAVPGRSTPVRLNVRPLQRPHPPIWIAAQRKEALPFIARRGANLALVPYATMASPEELRPMIAEYRAALPKGKAGTVSVALHLYEGPEEMAARTALQRYLDSRRSTQSVHYLRKVAEDPGHGRSERIESDGFAALGPTSTVSRLLDRYAELGVDEILALVDFGGLAPALVRGSVDRLSAQAERLARTGPVI
jgi:alkanesulfonate monooxygenase SsuD/methylene tetrahydromethanopterin reductase-like flavin-dependent oxidoreductase (luciferase family)